MAVSEEVLRILRSGLRLRQLRMLQVLAEHGSVHAAAEVLGLSQPAVTKSLQEVEALLGFTLFQRTAQGIHPTELCKPMLRFALDVETNLAAAINAIERERSGEAEEIAIGTCGGRAAELISLAMEAHAQQRACLRVDVLEREPGRLIAAVISGRVQWGVGFRPAAPNDSIEFESLQPERYVIVARTGHRLLEAPERASIFDVATQPWVLNQLPPAVHDAWLHAFRAVQAPVPQVAITVGSLGSFAATLRRLDGIGVIDATSARLLPGCSVYELPSFGAMSAVLGILSARQHRLTPGAMALLAQVRAVAHATPSSGATTAASARAR